VVNKFLLGFASIALAVASAASTYKVTFYQPVEINGTKLKAGDYRVEVNGSTAVIKKGKAMAEAPVKVENASEKYKTDSVRMEGDQVAEIRVGGTHTLLVFGKTGDATK
jgi:hypothetical protein